MPDGNINIALSLLLAHFVQARLIPFQQITSYFKINYLNNALIRMEILERGSVDNIFHYSPHIYIYI